MSGEYVIASPFGLGDTYFLAALGSAFTRHYGEHPVLLVKESHRDLATMFPDVIVRTAPDHELDTLQTHATASRVQSSLSKGGVFLAHPRFVYLPPDICVAAGYMTDAKMYALILGLDPRYELSLPTVSNEARQEAEGIANQLGIQRGRTALFFPNARSWPLPVAASFWEALSENLKAAGWGSVWNNHGVIPLRCVIPFCEIAGWAIGANCGITQTIVMGRAVCRKTVITPTSPNPYNYFTKIDGLSYDIEEFHVMGNPPVDIQITNRIATGRNARGPVPDPDPRRRIEVLVSPGDLADRLSILWTKSRKMPERFHLFARDVALLEERFDELVKSHPGIFEKLELLFKANLGAWDANEILISQGGGEDGYKTWTIAHGFNMERMRLKNEIDVMCGSNVREEKSWN